MLKFLKKRFRQGVQDGTPVTKLRHGMRVNIGSETFRVYRIGKNARLRLIEPKDT